MLSSQTTQYRKSNTEVVKKKYWLTYRKCQFRVIYQKLRETIVGILKNSISKSAETILMKSKPI